MKHPGLKLSTRRLTQLELSSQVTSKDHLRRIAENGRARRVYRIAIDNGMTVRLARFERPTRYMCPKK
jgi:hypothetical protein